MAAAVQVMQSSACSTRPQASATTAPVLEFVCLFTHDLRRKQKRWQDGRIRFHTFNKRIMVYDERGNFVGDTHWREDYDFDEGEEVELERGGIIVQVAECTGSRDQDLSELVDKRVQEKVQRQSAAVARRPSTLEPTTPHLVAPHFQLRHKPLHHLIGTPTGHHGRALVPTESPYEERQKVAVSPQDNSARPTKRRKRDTSPPSKSGYAQSLFGAALTLSGRPTSTTPLRNQHLKIPPILGDHRLPASSDSSNHEDDSDPVHEPAHMPIANAQVGVLGDASRNTLLASFSRESRKTSAKKTAEPGRSSSPLGYDSPNNPRSFDYGIGQPRSKRNKAKHDRTKERDLLQPVSMNRIPRNAEIDKLDINRAKSKGNCCDDVSTLGRKKLDNSSLAPQLKTSVHNRELTAEGRFEDTSRMPDPNRKGQGLYPEGSTMNELRTELRIQPKKKRGLLMVSEKSGISGSPLISKMAKTRIDHPSSATLSSKSTKGDEGGKKLPTDKITDVETAQNDGRRQITAQPKKDVGRRQRSTADTDIHHPKAVGGIDNTPLDTTATGQPYEEEVLDCMEIVLSHNGLIVNPNSSGKRITETGKCQQGTFSSKNASDVFDDSIHHKDCDPSASGEDRFKEIAPRTRRNKPSDKQVEASDAAHEDIEWTNTDLSRKRRRQPSRKKARSEDSLATHSTDRYDRRLGMSDDDGEFALPDNPPAPRLAHLGRKSIRSKEVIGFVFEESEHNDAPRRDENDNDVESPATSLPLGQSTTGHSVQPSGDMEKATATDGRCLQTRQCQGQKEMIVGGEELTREPVIDQNISAREIETQHLPERQASSRSNRSNEEADVQIQTPEENTAVARPQPPAKVIANPATRGKKAAKPSDAAGQVPQCPLPPEAVVCKSLHIETHQNLRKKSGVENQSRGAAPAAMSGFTRANGGPWSREAHDLFEFTRPP
ncbi:hypothetical protein F4779DRAFT_120152 [Xylariaceae sp. FL0662B]|nr:hypothetical protein F4779DRAFT_120152 [Xylariaceae sp. FL0662B]